MSRQIRIAVTAPQAIIRIMRKSCIEPIAYLPRPQDVEQQAGWMVGPRAGPIPGSIAPIQCLGDRSAIGEREARLAQIWRLISERILCGEAFVGELDAPEIAGGIEDLDAQFKAAVVFRVTHADHAEFLRFLR